MKNFETILNVGEDAANYIKVENVSQFVVVEPEKIGRKTTSS